MCLLAGSAMGARQLRGNSNRQGKNLLGTFPFNAQEGEHHGDHHGAGHGANHPAQALESRANRQKDSSIDVGFGAVPGASPGADGKKCYDKATTVVQDAPKEQCTLELQRTCKHVTKMVPKLEATEQCVNVPKEVRTRSSNSNSKDAVDEKPINGRGSLHKEASITDKERIKKPCPNCEKEFAMSFLSRHIRQVH